MSTHPEVRPARPWKTAVLGGMASYLDAATLVTTGIALVLYTQALGIDALTFGVLSALLTIMFAVGSLIGGRLGDRFGRRRVYNVTLALFLVGVIVLALAVNVAMLYAGVVIAGLAIGADLPVSLALIAEEAPKGRKGRMVAFSAVLWLVGITAVTLISTFVGGFGELGGRIMYGHLAVVALVVLILRASLRESAEWTAATQEVGVVKAGDRVQVRTLRQLFSRPVVFSLLATALFYGIWSIAANTIGQFSAFMYVTLAGVPVPTFSLLLLVTSPIGLVAGLLFMRFADSRHRGTWFIAGAIITVLSFATPLVFGASLTSLLVLSIGFGIGSAFAGEAIYKVWSQELFPTLLRSTAQGVTIAFARVLAAIFAVFTPTLVIVGPSALFAFLTVCAVIVGAIGIFWIARLPKATELEPAPQVDAVLAEKA